jgi:hypothetical protein
MEWNNQIGHVTVISKEPELVAYIEHHVCKSIDDLLPNTAKDVMKPVGSCK